MIERGALRDALVELDGRLALAVARRREADPFEVDPFRGLYVSDEQVDELLTGSSQDRYTDSELPPPTGPIADVASRFGLDPFESFVLLVALAPDLDVRYERIYGYVHDDVSRRRASIGLAIELAGGDSLDPVVRASLCTDAPLRRCALVHVDDDDRPYLTRSLRVPDPVQLFVLGGALPTCDLRPAMPFAGPAADAMARALRTATATVYAQQETDHGAEGFGAAALTAVCGSAIVWDPGQEPPDLHSTRAALRDARLGGRGLIVGPIDEFDPHVIRLLADSDWPVVLHGRGGWQARWSDVPPLVLELRSLDGAARGRAWSDALGHDFDATLARSLAAFRLGPGQTRRAIRAAAVEAAAHETGITAATIAAGARLQNGGGLERLARRIQPSVGWDDLVVAPATAAALRHLADRVAHRDVVLDHWGLRRGGGRGEAVTVLFAGESGTGKTMAAEVIGGAIGLDVYVIDLSTVVDKYIGETEKNLERVFTEAEGVNGVLFFDEADAIFGKRSEVSDARDRYANVEIAYLLQRMERFDGLAILATNLRANLDEAFSRRLGLIVDFAEPDEEQRLLLYEKSLRGVPVADDLDLAFCARSFDVTGGDIRNIAVTAAYLAAADGEPVATRHLIGATRFEYRKLGRLCLESEFGPYFAMIRAG